MSPFARIAALHRELAEAYERLAEGDMPKARRKPPAPKPDVSASPAAIAAVLAIVITFDSRDRSSVVVSGEVSRERFRAHLDGAVKIISSWWRRQQQQ
jgi:hypothetical protein